MDGTIQEVETVLKLGSSRTHPTATDAKPGLIARACSGPHRPVGFVDRSPRRGRVATIDPELRLAHTPATSASA